MFNTLSSYNYTNINDSLWGILGAMKEEISLIKDEMKIYKVDKYADKIFYIGSIYGKNVVLVQAGVGTINVAMTTQILITKYNINSILLTGVAGALYPKLEIGDIIISTENQYHDVNFTPLGYPIGLYPEMIRKIFPCDICLVQLANKAAYCNNYKVYNGKILSGDSFINDPQVANYLWREFNGLAVEAEGAAIGQVCFFNNIPYINIRTISDLSWSYEESSDLFSRNLVDTSQKSQNILLTMIWLYISCE